MDASLLGTFTNFKIAPALTASGGELFHPIENRALKRILNKIVGKNGN
jgi:hypothetical protein